MDVRKCNNFLDENAPGFLVEFRGDFLGQMKQVDYACGDIITDTLALVSVSEENLDRLRKDVPAIIFIETRGIYTLQSISPSTANNINPLKLNPYLNLTGRNVIVGMIDTGINYTNPEFIREDETSRVLYLWDQTLEIKKEPYAYIGSIYSNTEINEALKVKNSGGNPYEVVPSVDEIGHGTKMAGIIGARGYNGEMEGVAKDCDFIVVKLLPSPNYQKILRENNLPIVPAYNSTEVLSGIEFIRSMAKDLNRPLVIYMGVGTNDGSHDGYSIAAEYITSITTKSGVVFVAGTGNQGNNEGHVSNYIKNSGEVDTVELYMSKDMKQFTLFIWVQKPNRMLLSLIAPTGEETGYFTNQISAKSYRKFYLIDSEVYVWGIDPEYLTGHQVFILRFYNIKAGIWKIKLKGELIFSGRYDIWLDCKELLPEGMKFLESDSESTLTAPSTTKNTISVAYYDGKTGAQLAEAGKGFNSNGVIKPDIAAVGTDVLTISRNGEQVEAVNGSSVATAITAGLSALFLQWSIVDRNDKSMNSAKLRSLLIYSADREQDVEYPNTALGYGKLNALEVFNILGGNYRNFPSSRNYYEYFFENLFVRLPKDLIRNRSQDNKRQEIHLDNKEETVNKSEIYSNSKYIHYIVQYEGNYGDNYNSPPNVYFTQIDQSLAILSIKFDLLEHWEDAREVIGVFNRYVHGADIEIVYVHPPDLYSLQGSSATEASKYNPLYAGKSRDLSGRGVVIGIIDTGIDYLSQEFQDEAGKTRISEIWDQTIIGDGAPEKGAPFGRVYTREEIDKAIEAKRRGKDPYKIVPSMDINGHGTHMAGIIGGAGKNPEVEGMAPNCEFVIVKMVESISYKEFVGFGEYRAVYGDMAIFTAINFMKEYYRRAGKPLVIFMPLGTTNGNHKGKHMLSSYIESAVKNVGIVLVTGTGNEGMEDGHVSGTLFNGKTNEIIKLIIGKKQKVFYVGIWIDLPNIVDLNLISPTGQSTGVIRAVLNQGEHYSFIIENTGVHVYFDLPEKFSGDQLIRIYFYDVEPGDWKIELKVQKGNNVKYNAWMWQREFVGPGTRFAPSDPYGTITIPAESDYTISVAAYNQNNGGTVLYSGVALLGYNFERIDFAAGGVNTMTVGIDNSIAIVNGTSLAAAIGAGICVLLFEWGIVKGNYPYMYTQSIKTFLRRGTIQRRGEVYPNQQLGFGIINLYKIFESMT